MFSMKIDDNVMLRPLLDILVLEFECITSKIQLLECPGLCDSIQKGGQKEARRCEDL